MPVSDRFLAATGKYITVDNMQSPFRMRNSLNSLQVNLLNCTIFISMGEEQTIRKFELKFRSLNSNNKESIHGKIIPVTFYFSMMFRLQVNNHYSTLRTKFSKKLPCSKKKNSSWMKIPSLKILKKERDFTSCSQSKLGAWTSKSSFNVPWFRNRLL